MDADLKLDVDEDWVKLLVVSLVPCLFSFSGEFCVGWWWVLLVGWGLSEGILLPWVAPG